MLYAFSYDGYCYIALPRMDILDFSDFGHRYFAEGSSLLEAATKKVLMMDSLPSRTGGTCDDLWGLIIGCPATKGLRFDHQAVPFVFLLAHSSSSALLVSRRCSPALLGMRCTAFYYVHTYSPALPRFSSAVLLHFCGDRGGYWSRVLMLMPRAIQIGLFIGLWYFRGRLLGRLLFIREGQFASSLWEDSDSVSFWVLWCDWNAVKWTEPGACSKFQLQLRLISHHRAMIYRPVGIRMMIRVWYS